MSSLINNLKKTNQKIKSLSIFIDVGKIHCLHRYIDLFQSKKKPSEHGSHLLSLNVPLEKFFTIEDVTITQGLQN